MRGKGTSFIDKSYEGNFFDDFVCRGNNES